MDIRQFLKRKNDDEKKGSQKKKDEGENEDAEIENVSSKQSHASQSQAEESEQSASTGPAEPPPSKKHKKKNKGWGFREEWKVGRPWLKYDSSKGLMYCEICCGQNIQTKWGKTKRECLRESLFKYEARSCRRPRKGLACNFFICLVKKKVCLPLCLLNYFPYFHPW